MFPQKLKELREEKGYSMDKLAELYNNKFNGKMNKSTLSRYENGLQEPIYTVVVNLAKLFNVSVDYLSCASKKELSLIWKNNINSEETLLKEDESILISNYRNLNSSGQQMAKEYINLLLLDNKYTELPQFSPEPQYEMVAYGGKGTKGTIPKPTEETTAN